MRAGVSKTLLAAAAMLVALPAAAQTGAAIRTAHDALSTGDFARAERVLIAEQRIFPNSPEVLVDLAVVYARTGRVQQASALYRRILTRDDVLLDLSDDRAVGSHAIAAAGLRRVASLQTAAR